MANLPTSLQEGASETRFPFGILCKYVIQNNSRTINSRPAVDWIVFGVTTTYSDHLYFESLKSNSLEPDTTSFTEITDQQTSTTAPKMCKCSHT